MAIYYLYKEIQLELTCNAAGRGVIEAFEAAGCIPVTEVQFLNMKNQINSDDVIIVLISLRNEDCHKKLQSVNCKKILHSMDVSKSDKVLFRTQLEFCNRHNIETMINTFPSKRNMEFLSKAGINTITLPISGSPRKVSYENKKIDVLISGQLKESDYPVRCKIIKALTKSDIKYCYLPHSGIEGSTAIHQFHGKKFLDLLDICWIGVTCRAGNFGDSLVPKYIEFGFSKVLPVGDCPSYMYDDMSKNMIEINEFDSDDLIISKIKEALSDKQKLIDRIEKYSQCVHENYDMQKNIHRTLSMIKNNEFDSRKSK